VFSPLAAGRSSSVLPARLRALGATARSLVGQSLPSLPPQSEDSGARFGSRGDGGLVRVFGDYLAAELALDQGHAAEVVRHRVRHVLVLEVEVLLVVG
jgi:hypothetical protein